MHRWQSRAQCQCVDPNLIGLHEPVGTNIKCLCTALERLKGGHDIFCSPNFECIEFETERAGHRLRLAQLHYGDRISDISQDCHSAQTWNNLTQQFEPLASKIGRLDRQAGDVAARSSQTGDKAAGHGVPRPRKHNRDD